MFIDYYKIFDLPKNSTKVEIRKRYRELAKKYHPDINKDENATLLIVKKVKQGFRISNLMTQYWKNGF